MLFFADLLYVTAHLLPTIIFADPQAAIIAPMSDVDFLPTASHSFAESQPDAALLLDVYTFVPLPLLCLCSRACFDIRVCKEFFYGH